MAPTSERVIQAEVSAIRADDTQHRQHFDPESLRELAENIRVNGLWEPVILRRVQSDANGIAYELIAGERRWRAHKLLRRRHIKAIVRDVSAVDAATQQAGENIAREDVSALEEGLACAKLIAETGRNCRHSEAVRRAAKRMGWSEGKVKERVRLTHLPETLRDLIQRKHAGKGGLTLADAGVLALLFYEDPNDLESALPIAGPDYAQRAGQALSLAVKRTGKGMTLKAMRNAVAEILSDTGALFEAAPDGNEEVAREAAQTLANLCGGVERAYRVHRPAVRHLTHAVINRNLRRLEAVAAQHRAVVKDLEAREAELSGSKAAEGVA
jgi:ParB/RepB/Spo0J family partition protein